MNSKEIIYANLGHCNPSRPGLTFDNDRKNDMVGGGPGTPKGYVQKRWVEGQFEYYDDMWGNIWTRMTDGCAGGEVIKPAAPSRSGRGSRNRRLGSERCGRS